MPFRVSARLLKRLIYAGAVVGGAGAVVITVIPEVASRYQELEKCYAKMAEKIGLDKRFSDPPTGSVMAFEDQRKHMYNPLPPRQEILKSLEDEEFDILVIGGGATGTGVALDAVTRGLKTGLVEKFDFASGTSSRSTKLIHGGVRYLQKAVFNLDIEQYRMVKEALAERANLLNIAPHMATPFPIMLPVYKWWQLPYFWAGIKMYDIVAGRQVLKPSYVLSKSKALELFPMLKKDKLVGALVYYDGQHDDARMNVALAITAVRYGASVANYTEVVSLLKTTDNSGKERVSGARVRDRLTGKEWDVKAKCVVNATGPYTDRIRTLGKETIQKICQPSSGVHVVLPDYYSPESMGLLDPATSDGRVIFFLPWQNVTVAGTTDSPCEVSDYPQPTEDEIQFILKEIRNYLSPDVEVRRGDVLSAWSGIRPLVSDPNKTNTQSIARNHIIEVADNKLITIAGGKWTTYRHMAEETVDRAIIACNLPATKECCTKGLLLDGAHGWSPTLFIRLVQDFGVENQVAQHLASTYGDKAFKVAKLCNLTGKRWPVLGKRLHEEYAYVEGEVKYAVREYACRAIDVLARRTRLAFTNVHAAKEALPCIIDIMGQELGWDDKKKKEELEHADLFLRREMGLDIKQTSEAQLNFTKDEINQYVKRFKSLDYQNKGFVTINDLRRYFKKMGEKVTEDQLHDILSEVDLNRNAQVDLGEFLQLLTVIREIANNSQEPNEQHRKLCVMLTSRVSSDTENKDGSGGGALTAASEFIESKEMVGDIQSDIADDTAEAAQNETVPVVEERTEPEGSEMVIVEAEKAETESIETITEAEKAGGDSAVKAESTETKVSETVLEVQGADTQTGQAIITVETDKTIIDVETGETERGETRVEAESAAKSVETGETEKGDIVLEIENAETESGESTKGVESNETESESLAKVESSETESHQTVEEIEKLETEGGQTLVDISSMGIEHDQAVEEMESVGTGSGQASVEIDSMKTEGGQTVEAEKSPYTENDDTIDTGSQEETNLTVDEQDTEETSDVILSIEVTQEDAINSENTYTEETNIVIDGEDIEETSDITVSIETTESEENTGDQPVEDSDQQTETEESAS